MREILEWHAALKTCIERGYPLSDVWFGNYRRQIQSSLKQTEAVASTDTDQKAFPLLTHEFYNMNALTDKYMRIAASRDYLAPDSLNSDPLEQKPVGVLAVTGVEHRRISLWTTARVSRRVNIALLACGHRCPKLEACRREQLVSLRPESKFRV